jgi:hypothetical protein
MGTLAKGSSMLFVFGRRLNGRWGKGWWIWAPLMLILNLRWSESLREYVSDVLNVPQGGTLPAIHHSGSCEKRSCMAFVPEQEWRCPSSLSL